MAESEREQVEQQLVNLQKEGLREYMENRLDKVASRQVIEQVIQDFITVHNQEFTQNVAENIMAAKQQLQKLQAQLLQANSLTTQLQHSLEHEKQAHRDSQDNLQKWHEEKTNQLREQIHRLTNEHQKPTECTLKLEKDNAALKEELKNKQEAYEELKVQCEGLVNQAKAQKTRQVESLSQKHQSQISELQEIVEVLKVNQQAQLNSLRHQNQELVNQASLKDTQLQCFRGRVEQMRAQASQQKGKEEADTVALKYLQEENAYLRQQIRSFEDRYHSLSKDKGKVDKDYERLGKEFKKEREVNSNKLKETEEQLRAELARSDQLVESMLKEGEEKVSEMESEVAELRAELETYHSMIADKEQQIKKVEQERDQVQRQKERAEEELRLYGEYSKIHQGEIEQYQAQLQTVREESRAEVQTYKATYELNWNTTNEQLIETQYQLSQANSTIDNLNEQVQQLQSKQEYLMMKAEEGEHIKTQFQRFTKSGSKDGLAQGQRSQLVMQLSQAKVELQKLKTVQQSLRQQILLEMKQYHVLVGDNMRELLTRLRDRPQQYSCCNTLDELKNRTLQYGRESTKGLLKTKAKGDFGQIKKSMRNIQLKYEVVQQTNQEFSQRVQNIVNHP